MLTVIDITARTSREVYNERWRGADSITGILLHHTGSTSETGDIEWLTTPHARPVSAHKLFTRKGHIVKLVPEEKRAWHAGYSWWRGRDDCNGWMIGYEICNLGNGKEPYTGGQYEAVAQSIAYDCALFHIEDANVATHKAVRAEYTRLHADKALWHEVHPGEDYPEPKYDPATFDLNRIWRRVKQIRARWPYDPIVKLWSKEMDA